MKPGVTTDAAAEIKRSQKEVLELRKANEILKAASIFFANELDHRSTKMIRFINERRPGSPTSHSSPAGTWRRL